MNPRPGIDYGRHQGEVYLIDDKARLRFRARPKELLPNPFELKGAWSWGGFEAVSIRKPERLRKMEEDFRRKVQELIPNRQDRGLAWWYER